LGAASIPVLCAVFFRIHYRFDWNGAKKWSLDLEYGFPGFKRSRSFPIIASPPTHSQTPAPGQAGFIRLPRFHFDKERARRALFRFLTDGPVLGAVIRYAFRVAGLSARLLHPMVECAVGDPDPLRLAQICSAAYSFRALPFLQRVRIVPRFQDRTSTLHVRLSGGFSAMRAVIFFLAVLWAFPVFTVLRRAWHGWRNAELAGWRRFAFAQVVRFS